MMQQDYNIIIADTSCLILLSKIDELDLLKKLGDRICITPEIKSEFTGELPEWIKVKKTQNIHYQKILEVDLDLGEASAIALCLEEDDAILIIDDLKGREMAQKLKLRFSGTFGLILKLKQNGMIEKVKPILNKIKKTNFRFKNSLVDFVLKQSGEE